MLDKRNFYINGQWWSPEKINDFDVVDPSTENVIGVVSLGDIADNNLTHIHI